MQPGLILPPALGGIIIIVVVFNDQNDHRLDYSIGLKTAGQRSNLETGDHLLRGVEARIGLKDLGKKVGEDLRPSPTELSDAL